MRLRYTPASPFARKVRVAAALVSIPLELELADTLNASDTIRVQNPLGKIPILLLEGRKPLFDSPVILTYLDHVSGGRLIPADPEARIEALRLEALSDGLMEAAQLQVYEVRYRPEERREPSWVALQASKVERALEDLERDPPPVNRTPNVGDIALACALGYLDLRFEGRWRSTHPNLVTWLDSFIRRAPLFLDSAPA